MSNKIAPVQITRPEGIAAEVWEKAQAAHDRGLAASYLALTDPTRAALDVAKGIHGARVRAAVALATADDSADVAFRRKLADAARMLRATESERAILASARLQRAAEQAAIAATVKASDAPAADTSTGAAEHASNGAAVALQ